MRMEGTTVVFGRAILISVDCQCWPGHEYLCGLPAGWQILLLQSSCFTPRNRIISLGQLIGWGRNRERGRRCDRFEGISRGIAGDGGSHGVYNRPCISAEGGGGPQWQLAKGHGWCCMMYTALWCFVCKFRAGSPRVNAQGSTPVRSSQ